MTTDNFIQHNGRKCPVANGTLVIVKYRNGEIQPRNVANNWSWQHNLGDYDITHWRLVEQPKKENEPNNAAIIAKLEADKAELIEALILSNNLLNSIIHEAQDTAYFIESFNPLIKRIKGE